jgi:hypothetical protein
MRGPASVGKGVDVCEVFGIGIREKSSKHDLTEGEKERENLFTCIRTWCNPHVRMSLCGVCVCVCVWSVCV